MGGNDRPPSSYPADDDGRKGAQEMELQAATSAEMPKDPCATCGGDGEVLIQFVFGVQAQDCPDCFGSGDRQ